MRDKNKERKIYKNCLSASTLSKLKIFIRKTPSVLTWAKWTSINLSTKYKPLKPGRITNILGIQE